jgi:hypothetical protein
MVISEGVRALAYFTSAAERKARITVEYGDGQVDTFGAEIVVSLSSKR